VFMMFTSPPEQSLEWSDAGVQGSFRFLSRVWFEVLRRQNLIELAQGDLDRGMNLHTQFTSEHKAIRLQIHSILKQATSDINRQQFNTVVSAAMKMLNVLEGYKPSDTLPDGTMVLMRVYAQIIHEAMKILLSILYPIAPHICCAAWKKLKLPGNLIDAPWPTVEELALSQDEIELVVQVNGKLRGNMTVAKDATREAIEALARNHPNIEKFVAGQTIKKVIVVPGRLVNVVV
jgi:leucyl-tRNA synthetase